MSVIQFTCDPLERESVKAGVWKILQEHYLSTAFPNTNVEYKNEGKAVYRERLNALMKSELCSIQDTEDGFSIEFDSTENAGFSIADEVYRTNMGYSDQGLLFIDPIFDEIIKLFPNICFTAETECADEWFYEQSQYVYDGKQLTKTELNEDGEPIDDEDSSSAVPQDHFLYNVPRLYIDIDTLQTILNNHLHRLDSEIEKTGQIEANLTIMEPIDLNHTVVWTSATEEAIAEAVAHGYPESMGAVAFMFVYKRYSDGIISDDLRAIRAVVIQDDQTAAFAELCKDDSLRGALNAYYLGIISLHRLLVDNKQYHTYASLNPRESVMIISSKEQQILTKVVSGGDIPELDSNDRNMPEFNFFF